MLQSLIFSPMCATEFKMNEFKFLFYMLSNTIAFITAHSVTLLIRQRSIISSTSWWLASHFKMFSALKSSYISLFQLIIIYILTCKHLCIPHCPERLLLWLHAFISLSVKNSRSSSASNYLWWRKHRIFIIRESKSPLPSCDSFSFYSWYSVW